MCNPPVLTYPDFKVRFILTTDASKTVIGAVLSQVQDGWERPIAYASRQLNTPERNYTTSEAEMLALFWAVRYFQCYLHGAKFVAGTDHAALTYLKVRRSKLRENEVKIFL
jgi:hypothetical protein